MKSVLLVEDSGDDILLMQMACRKTGIPHSLHVVTDGEQALDYLAGNGKYSDRIEHPLPSLIFLDLNLPRRSGHSVLDWIRSQARFKSLPVVILSSSVLESDVRRAYELGTTSYLPKIHSQTEFRQRVRLILKYWLELNISSP